MAEPAPLPIIQEEEQIGDEFYEKIQAPKFVDFTAPEIRPSHDDRYWFCLRVGCDQNHGEELDSEAIYNNFILRVMAARSPNVRLRKMLNKREGSANLKCPLTAPSKPSKSRVPRLALISSLSKNMVDNKPLSNVNATPEAKVNQSSAKAKALTTPSKYKQKSSNLEHFRTVQSKKPMNVVVPKNRGISKALVFHSPVNVKIKSSVDLKKTPMKSLCSAMKKLELDSVNKKKNEEASRKKLRGREVKSRVFDSLYSNKCLKEEKKKKEASKVLEEGDDDDSSDMEIDEKSRGGSLERCTDSSSSEETVKKSSQECEEDNEKTKISEAINRNYNDDKENEGEFIENDEKENASVPDENRMLVNNNDNLKKAKNEDIRKTQKKKPTSNATGSQVVKYRKLKPTNPKPFKLRTDERGILKEANLDKKAPPPLKEITTNGGKGLSKHHNVNKKNEEDTDHNYCEERLGQAKPGDQSGRIRCPVVHKSSVKVKSKLSATPHRSAAPRVQKHMGLAERLKQRDKSAQKLDEKFKVKSQMIQPTLVRPKGALSRKKGDGVLSTPGKQVRVIDEKCSEHMEVKEAEVARACTNGVSPMTKACSSSSKAKRATTVPKEPNFHSLHVPKSCTKKLT